MKKKMNYKVVLLVITALLIVQIEMFAVDTWEVGGRIGLRKDAFTSKAPIYLQDATTALNAATAQIADNTKTADATAIAVELNKDLLGDPTNFLEATQEINASLTPQLGMMTFFDALDALHDAIEKRIKGGIALPGLKTAGADGDIKSKILDQLDPFLNIFYNKPSGFPGDLPESLRQSYMKSKADFEKLHDQIVADPDAEKKARQASIAMLKEKVASDPTWGLLIGMIESGQIGAGGTGGGGGGGTGTGLDYSSIPGGLKLPDITFGANPPKALDPREANEVLAAFVAGASESFVGTGVADMNALVRNALDTGKAMSTFTALNADVTKLMAAKNLITAINDAKDKGPDAIAALGVGAKDLKDAKGTKVKEAIEGLSPVVDKLKDVSPTNLANWKGDEAIKALADVVDKLKATEVTTPANWKGDEAIKALADVVDKLKAVEPTTVANWKGNEAIKALTTVVGSVAGVEVTTPANWKGDEAIKALADVVDKLKGVEPADATKWKGNEAIKALADVVDKLKGAELTDATKTYKGDEAIKALADVVDKLKATEVTTPANWKGNEAIKALADVVEKVKGVEATTVANWKGNEAIKALADVVDKLKNVEAPTNPANWKGDEAIKALADVVDKLKAVEPTTVANWKGDEAIKALADVVDKLKGVEATTVANWKGNEAIKALADVVDKLKDVSPTNLANWKGDEAIKALAPLVAEAVKAEGVLRDPMQAFDAMNNPYDLKSRPALNALASFLPDIYKVSTKEAADALSNLSTSVALVATVPTTGTSPTPVWNTADLLKAGFGGRKDVVEKLAGVITPIAEAAGLDTKEKLEAAFTGRKDVVEKLATAIGPIVAVDAAWKDKDKIAAAFNGRMEVLNKLPGFKTMMDGMAQLEVDIVDPTKFADKDKNEAKRDIMLSSLSAFADSNFVAGFKAIANDLILKAFPQPADAKTAWDAYVAAIKAAAAGGAITFSSSGGGGVDLTKLSTELKDGTKDVTKAVFESVAKKINNTVADGDMIKAIAKSIDGAKDTPKEAILKIVREDAADADANALKAKIIAAIPTPLTGLLNVAKNAFEEKKLPGKVIAHGSIVADHLEAPLKARLLDATTPAVDVKALVDRKDDIVKAIPGSGDANEAARKSEVEVATKSISDAIAQITQAITAMKTKFGL